MNNHPANHRVNPTIRSVTALAKQGPRPPVSRVTHTVRRPIERNKVKATVCVFYGDKAYKLFWLSEDPKGVYVGMHGAFAGSHLSYHADGTKHFRRPPKKKPILPSQNAPIKEITKPVQLLNSYIEITEFQLSGIAEPYSSAENNRVEIFLGANICDDTQRLSVDSFLVHRSHESELIKFLHQRDTKDLEETLLTFTSFGLSNFENHKCVLACFEVFRKVV